MMKRFLLAILIVMATLPAFSKEKTAILMVHFGTSYDDTRALTIDAINQAVRDAFRALRSVKPGPPGWLSKNSLHAV